MLKVSKISFLLLSFVIFVACDKNTPVIPDEDESVTIGFSFKADIDISEMPLVATKAGEPVQTYAIQVFEYSSNTNSLLPYAYGIFDDVSKMSITMNKGKKYKIYAGLFFDFFVKYKFGGYHSTLFYSGPNNAFVYSQDWVFLHWLQNLSTGYDMFFQKTDGKDASRSMIESDSYCGILEEFSPKENDRVDMQLIRSAFGIQINVTGMTEGRLVWEGRAVTPGVGMNSTFQVCSIEAPATTYDQIFTLAQYLRSTTVEDNYIHFYLYYFDSNNTKQILNQNSITVHRNKKTVVNITLQSESNSDVNRSFSISRSQQEMGTEVLTYTFSID